MAYSIATSYVGDSLISGFNFVATDMDASGGWVSYKDQADASSLGLYSVIDDVVTLSVDSSTVLSPTGATKRPSVRLESDQAFNHGLFIAGFDHMPGSACGSWPAFFLSGTGQIDIIQGANTVQKNLFACHTTATCSLSSSNFTGSVNQGLSDCTAVSNGANVGCEILPPNDDINSFGDSFNAAGGGVYAVEWTDEAIKIWTFAWGEEPDLDSPDPTTWGLPQAAFGGSSCDVDSAFSDMKLGIDLNLCGAYAGDTWSDDAACAASADTCIDWVAQNPGALSSLFWKINGIFYYTKSDTPSSMPVPAWGGSTCVTPGNPPSVEDYSYLGCFGSLSNYSTFSLESTDPDMDIDLCVAACSGRAYAGAYNTDCYCADSLDGDYPEASDNECALPCPGNSAQTCGGNLFGNGTLSNHTLSSRLMHRSSHPLSGRPHRRAVNGAVVLSIFGNVDIISPAVDPAPAIAPDVPGGGGSSSVPTTTATTSTTATFSFSTTNTASTTLTSYTTEVIESTITYSIVCPTDPGILTVTEYCARLTITRCGCADETTLSVPMTTTAMSCHACGANGENSITLTVPVMTPTAGNGAATGAAGVASSAGAASTSSPAGYVTAAAPRVVGGGRMEVFGAAAAGLAVLLVALWL